MSEPSTTGGCLCGSIRFELTEPASAAGYCHCKRCQRRTGAGASPQARIDGRTFRLLAGEDLLSGWSAPDSPMEKCFCSRCGSHVFARDPTDPSQMSIRLGAFDGDPGVRLQWHSYTDYAPPWEPVPDDGLVRYPQGKPR